MKTWNDVLLEAGKPSWAEMESFASLVGINSYDYSEEFSQRVTKEFVASWICTDTRVGLAVYRLDGEVIAVSGQNARKSDEDIEFVSIEAAKKVRDLIISLLEFNPPVADMDTELSDKWFGHKD